MPVIDTGGVPYNITLVLDKPYMITTDINVADGLTNGTVGKLATITFDENNEAKFLWLEFVGCHKTGAEARRKTANYALNYYTSRKVVLIGKENDHNQFHENGVKEHERWRTPL
ncbi:hypothetical protein QAD02_003141 [Eretmocerus hayati]|uniref:Uncharacterized protein n=1 Tax=Eretmocerus hayati TaxID=131215 RepID=A0ACC2NLA2_9HYME|nr:hypothetical protein QAD02_003141 [Eretmocerus hayati]